MMTYPLFGRRAQLFLAAAAAVAVAISGGACSIDRGGLEAPGTGGDVGFETGGASASGGDTGSGGDVGSGGAVGSGGTVASGGAVGSGGAIGTGGAGGAGGVRATGGAGMGGSSVLCNQFTCPNGCCGPTGLCVTNQNDQRCGTAGAACTACGACFQCGSGACQPRPSAKWTLTCGSATLSATKPGPGNMDWDMMAPGITPLPDPFCQLTVNGMSAARTTTILNTLTPVWNQTLTPVNMDITSDFLTAQPARWTLSVFDDDGNQTAVESACLVTPRLTAADLTAGTVTFPATQSCTSLSIQLTCAQ